MNKIFMNTNYIGPEVLFEKYDQKCDVWSWGIILCIMFCGYPSFNGENDSEILSKIKLGKLNFLDEEWEHVSDSAKDFIKKILTFKPDKDQMQKVC